MKIFFTTPFNGKRLYQEFIDEIIKVIEETGAIVISPEKSDQYNRAFAPGKLEEYGTKNKAHYEFIRQGIASADAVIFESTYEDFRVGHETTLGLMYGKPVLVLSQKEDYSQYISHERLFGKIYKSKEDLKNDILGFLKFVETSFNNESYQILDEVVDLQHSATLSLASYKALQGQSYFADWSRRSIKEEGKVHQEILDKLGDLPIQPAWDVFAKIYNEDTPDNVFYGPARFADKVFKKNGVSKSETVIDCACGTGAISRLLTSLGYKNLHAFDRSRAMLSEAYHLCSHLPSIKIQEEDIKDIALENQVKAITWFDFSSNFALTEKEFSEWLRNLSNNLQSNGILIFDVRTRTGWDVDFFKHEVTTYETDTFQRIWINLPDYKNDLITFDIFIRVKDKNGEWLPWEREQMTERVWDLADIKSAVEKLDEFSLEGIYGDDFTLLSDNSLEPRLAYFVLKKK